MTIYRYNLFISWYMTLVIGVISSHLKLVYRAIVMGFQWNKNTLHQTSTGPFTLSSGITTQRIAILNWDSLKTLRTLGGTRQWYPINTQGNWTKHQQNQHLQPITQPNIMVSIYIFAASIPLIPIHIVICSWPSQPCCKRLHCGKTPPFVDHSPRATMGFHICG